MVDPAGSRFALGFATEVLNSLVNAPQVYNVYGQVGFTVFRPSKKSTSNNKLPGQCPADTP